MRTFSLSLFLFFSVVFLSLVLMEGIVRAFVTVRNVGPSFSTFDPIYGKRLKSSFSTVRATPEFQMTFSTNAMGFRGGEVQLEQSRPILFVGDSFTMGYGVSDGAEFPAIVGRRLGAAIVNAGIGDSGNGRVLKFLQNEGHDLDPRLVVVQFTENDFQDNRRERMYAIDPSTNMLIDLGVPEAGRLHRAQAWIEAVPWLAHSHLVGFARQVVSEALRPRAASRQAPGMAEQRGGDRLTFELAGEILALLSARRWPALVITVGLSERRLATMQDICRRYGVDLIVVPSKEHAPHLYYQIDGHWNAQGHAHVADLVVALLKRNGDI